MHQFLKMNAAIMCYKHILTKKWRKSKLKVNKNLEEMKITFTTKHYQKGHISINQEGHMLWIVNVIRHWWLRATKMFYVYHFISRISNVQFVFSFLFCRWEKLKLRQSRKLRKQTSCCKITEIKSPVRDSQHCNAIKLSDKSVVWPMFGITVWATLLKKVKIEINQLLRSIS